jgi:hypothetical protein
MDELSDRREAWAVGSSSHGRFVGGAAKGRMSSVAHRSRPQHPAIPAPEPNPAPSGHLWASQHPPAFLSGRQDLNLRPPGPQPGALPDCATPRGQQAGDGNRTRPKSLEGFCATTTLRPRAERQSYRRSSTGTAPSSSTSPGGGQGPNQLSRAPSSVTVDPLKAFPSGEASRATSQACSATSPVR